MGVEDLFWQSGWDYSTIERMSVLLSTDHFGYYGPQPEFSLDGIPFEPGFFGVAYSQLFPISFFKIDRQETLDGFGIINGQPYRSGLMNIESEPVPRGISLYGSGQLGHNSGEPGPWVFDPDRVTPNVERFGPWLDAGLAAGYGGFFARGALRHHSYLNIDEFVQTRLINMRRVPDQNIFLGVEAKTTLGVVEAGFLHNRGEIRLQAVQSETEDFLFFHPLGREVPTGFDMSQYSGLANLYLTSGIGLRGLYQRRFHKTVFRENFFNHVFDWEKEQHTARASVFFDSDIVGAEAGLEHTHRQVNARNMVTETLSIPAVFLQTELQFLGSINLTTSNDIQFFNNEAPLNSSASLRFEPQRGAITEMGYQYLEMMPEFSNPFDVWTGRGYDMYKQLQIQANLPENLESARLLDLHASQSFRLPYNTSVKTGIRYIRHYALHVPFQFVQYDLPFSTQPGEYTLHPSESGERMIASIAFMHEPAIKISQEAGLTWSRTTSGSETYQDYWKMIPELSVQYTLYYTPYSDLEIRLDLQYLSKREWPEYIAMDGEDNRSFHPHYPYKFFTFTNTLPRHFNIDVRVSKWLWQQRLRTALVLKNLLNSDFQTHPLGIRESFGYMARLEIRF